METHTYYSLPLRIDTLVDGQTLSRCSLRDSIYQHLYLLLITHFDETRFNRVYGCAIWENDFTLMGQIKWKDFVRESFERTIQDFEPRLSNSLVQINMIEFELMTASNRYIRKRLEIQVKAIIRQTNEPFTFFEHLFIAPMSTE